MRVKAAKQSLSFRNPSFFLGEVQQFLHTYPGRRRCCEKSTSDLLPAKKWSHVNNFITILSNLVKNFELGCILSNNLCKMGLLSSTQSNRSNNSSAAFFFNLQDWKTFVRKCSKKMVGVLCKFQIQFLIFALKLSACFHFAINFCFSANVRIFR